MEDFYGTVVSDKTPPKTQDLSHRLQVEYAFSRLRICQKVLVVELEVFQTKGTSAIMGCEDELPRTI